MKFDPDLLTKDLPELIVEPYPERTSPRPDFVFDEYLTPDRFQPVYRGRVFPDSAPDLNL